MPRPHARAFKAAVRELRAPAGATALLNESVAAAPVAAAAAGLLAEAVEATPVVVQAEAVPATPAAPVSSLSLS
eukprot:COSAG03_NODE_1315_length_4344_cov_1.992462_1_plen_73_part_10